MRLSPFTAFFAAFALFVGGAACADHEPDVVISAALQQDIDLPANADTVAVPVELVFANVGGALVSSEGTFVAPHDGLYAVSATIATDNAGPLDVRLELGQRGGPWTPYAAGADPGVIGTIIPLEGGQAVRLVVGTGANPPRLRGGDSPARTRLSVHEV